jgi:hypothetical protein
MKRALVDAIRYEDTPIASLCVLVPLTRPRTDASAQLRPPPPAAGMWKQCTEEYYGAVGEVRARPLPSRARFPDEVAFGCASEAWYISLRWSWNMVGSC